MGMRIKIFAGWIAGFEGCWVWEGVCEHTHYGLFIFTGAPPSGTLPIAPRG